MFRDTAPIRRCEGTCKRPTTAGGEISSRPMRRQIDTCLLKQAGFIADERADEDQHHGRRRCTAIISGVIFVSSRAMGLRASFPVTPRPPDSNSSGAWTTTSSDLSGTLMIFLQFGQGPDLPANLSLT